MTELSDETRRQLKKIAEEGNLGSMVPEGDGWSWEFNASPSAIAALGKAYMIGYAAGHKAGAEEKRESLRNLVSYFEKRAAENSIRSREDVPESPHERWHSGKADTYKRAAQKLTEALDKG